MPFRTKACLILAVPLLCFADDSRPICSSQNHGQMWPEAANHDRKLMASLIRCGELVICVRGTWHYQWQAPSVRYDQLSRDGKPQNPKSPTCEAPSLSETSRPDGAAKNEKLQ